MAPQSRTSIRGQAVTALQTVAALATVRDGALRIANDALPLAFVVSTAFDEPSHTFGQDLLTYGFDVFFYVESPLGQEAQAEATIDTVVSGGRAALKAAGFDLGPSRIVPAPGGTALHQLGDRYYRVERQPLTFEQTLDED